MTLALDQTPPRIHPLSYLEEAGEVVVGRTDIDSYGVFPPDGAALLRRLEAGSTPAQAADWYARTYGETVDIEEFLETLKNLDFLVADPDAAGPAPSRPVEQVRWQGLGRVLFSGPAWIGYAALVGFAVALMVADPRLAPQRSNVFFTRYLAVVELTMFAGQIPLSLLHESFHVLAGRRLGLRSYVRLSHRYYFLVWETVLDGLVVVPRRKRYLPMLAGVVADILAVSLLTAAAALTRTPQGEITLAGGICLALAFGTVIRIAWQGYFYLRTDAYYLVTTVLGCHDLHTTARQMLANRVNRLLGREARLVDEEAWHPRDRRVARWYGPLMVVGYAFSTLMLILVFLPLTGQFLSRALQPLLSGEGSTAQIWDSATVLVLTLGQFALVGYLAARRRRQDHIRPSRAESPRDGLPQEART